MPLLIDPEDDVRDNILKYDEEGGGEEDQVSLVDHERKHGRVDALRAAGQGRRVSTQKSL